MRCRSIRSYCCQFRRRKENHVLHVNCFWILFYVQEIRQLLVNKLSAHAGHVECLEPICRLLASFQAHIYGTVPLCEAIYTEELLVFFPLSFGSNSPLPLRLIKPWLVWLLLPWPLPRRRRISSRRLLAAPRPPALRRPCFRRHRTGRRATLTGRCAGIPRP